MKMAREIGTCLVHINGPTVDDEPTAPFGGVGDSGFGRFGGQDASGEFTEPRCVNSGTAASASFRSDGMSAQV